MSFKVIPKTYQEDSEDTRKEYPADRYEKMYHEEYVQNMAQLIRDLSDSLTIAIQRVDNRGTQRAAIPLIKRAHKLLKDWKTR